MSKGKREARIVVFGNRKGGVGKTTLSVGVAGAWIEMGYEVLIVDTDPQRSAYEQLEKHASMSVVEHDGGNLDNILPKIKRSYDFIIVDTPAGVNDALTSALRVADVLIIPVKPSPHDYLSSKKTLDLARAAGVKTGFVINEAVARTRFAKQVREALSAYKAPIFKQTIWSRNAHREVAAMSLTITEVRLNGDKAAKDIRGLAKELIAFMGG